MKRLVAKVGEYQKDGQTKGEYVRIGVIGESKNGEYILLDPAVNLAGVLTQQNLYAHSQQKKPSKRVMVSIFDDSQQQGGSQNNNQAPLHGHANQQKAPDFDDDIPF